MDPGSRLTGQDSDPSSSKREVLKSLASRIEHKFFFYRAYDLDTSIVIEVLSALGDLQKSLSLDERETIKKIIQIENLCYSAISLFKEPQNREHFFNALRSIASAIKHV